MQTPSYRRKCLEQALKRSLKRPLWGSSGPEMLNPQRKTRKIPLKRSLKRPLLHRDRAQVGMCSGDSDWDVAAPNSPHKRSEKRPLLQMDRALIRVRSGTPALPYHPDPFRPHANAGDVVLIFPKQPGRRGTHSSHVRGATCGIGPAASASPPLPSHPLPFVLYKGIGRGIGIMTPAGRSGPRWLALQKSSLMSSARS